MLHTESVDSNTFELLKTMMADTFLDGFFLYRVIPNRPLE